MTTQRQFTKTFDHTLLHIKWNQVENPKAVIVIAHGLGEHLGRYDYVAKKFNDWGYGVLRYDQRGHGFSEGERGFLKDYKDLFLDADYMVEMAIFQNEDVPVFLMGHSMGGYTSIGYGILYDHRVKGLIFSGPLSVDSQGLTSQIDMALDPHIQFPNALADAVCSDRAVVDEYIADENNLKNITLGLMQQIKLSVPWIQDHMHQIKDPTLILHGSLDQLVNPKDSEILYAMISSEDKSRHVFEGLWHEILNETKKDEVLDVIHTWIEKHI